MRIFLEGLFTKRTDNSLVQFFRYGIVSGAALIIDFGGLVLLKEVFSVNYIVAASISFVAGLIVNYIISIFWVFTSSSLKSRWAEFGLFAIIGLAGLGINDITMWLLTDVFGIFYVVSKLVSTVFTFLWNFSIRKILLFNASRGEKDNGEKD